MPVLLRVYPVRSPPSRDRWRIGRFRTANERPAASGALQGYRRSYQYLSSQWLVVVFSPRSASSSFRFAPAPPAAPLREKVAIPSPTTSAPCQRGQRRRGSRWRGSEPEHAESRRSRRRCRLGRTIRARTRQTQAASRFSPAPIPARTAARLRRPTPVARSGASMVSPTDRAPREWHGRQRDALGGGRRQCTGRQRSNPPPSWSPLRQSSSRRRSIPFRPAAAVRQAPLSSAKTSSFAVGTRAGGRWPPEGTVSIDGATVQGARARCTCRPAPARRAASSLRVSRRRTAASSGA